MNTRLAYTLRYAVIVSWLVLLSGSQPAKADTALAKEIGVAAFKAIEQMPANDFKKVRLLTMLARALLDAGDKDEARTVIGRAQSIGTNQTLLIGDIFVLSMRGGDTQGALTFIRKVNEIAQLEAFDKWASEQVRNGQNLAIEETLEWVEVLRATAPRGPAPDEYDATNALYLNFTFRYGVLLGNVGKAYAVKGDIGRALTFVDKIASPVTQYVLLEAVAQAQHKAGDEAATAESVRLLSADIEKYYAKDPKQMVWAKALSFGRIGVIDRARKEVESLTDKASRDALYERLADELAISGDFNHAEEIAIEHCPISTFVSIGTREVKAGDFARARRVFLLALERGQHLKMMPALSNLIYGLISTAEFAKAVDLTERVNDLNRPPFLLKAVQEAGRQSDMAALRLTIPRLFEVLQQLKVPLLEQQFSDLIDTLKKAGLEQEAQTASALGEKNSARLKAMGRAFLSPERIVLAEIDGDIARHELAAAASKIPSLSHTLKDPGLEHLAFAQASDGRVKEAFETAKQVVDPEQRGASLIGLVVPAANAAP